MSPGMDPGGDESVNDGRHSHLEMNEYLLIFTRLRYSLCHGGQQKGISIQLTCTDVPNRCISHSHYTRCPRVARTRCSPEGEIHDQMGFH